MVRALPSNMPPPSGIMERLSLSFLHYDQFHSAFFFVGDLLRRTDTDTTILLAITQYRLWCLPDIAGGLYCSYFATPRFCLDGATLPQLFAASNGRPLRGALRASIGHRKALCGFACDFLGGT